MLETAEFKHLKEQEQRNKNLIKHCWDEMWNKRNIAVLDECLLPNIVFGGPRTSQKGLAAYKEMYKMYASAFENTRVEVQELIASDNKVISRVLFSGVHTGELNGIPASGKKLEVQVVTIFRIEHGKITEEWELYDEMGMMLQLGMKLQANEPAD